MTQSYEVFHEDVQTVVHFYRDVLGFHRDPRQQTDSSRHVVVTRANAQVGCSYMPGDSRPPEITAQIRP